MPNLVEAAVTGTPAAFAEAAARAAESDEDTVIVGHSGAGAVLPVVAAQLRWTPRQIVFVDDVCPTRVGAFRAGGGLLLMLRELATNGRLAQWSQWWGEGVMEALIRDDRRRREIEPELPHVPLAFYDTPIEVPTAWCQRAAAYVLLSEAYRPEAVPVIALGWPVVERLGEHLDIVNDEQEIVQMLVGLGEYP